MDGRRFRWLGVSYIVSECSAVKS